MLNLSVTILLCRRMSFFFKCHVTNSSGLAYKKVYMFREKGKIKGIKEMWVCIMRVCYVKCAFMKV